MTFGPSVDPVLLPPAESEAVSYLGPLLAPTPVATRLPQPDKQADTINGMLRIEAGGGYKPNRFQYDVQYLLHGYSPDEIQAETITRQGVALMAAGRGQTVNGWYVVGVMNVVAPHRLKDPDVVNLTRYRAMVTWRVAGQQWNP